MPPPPPPITRKMDVWPLPLFDGSVEQITVAEEEKVARFLELPEDPVETSRNAFEQLLEARQGKTTLGQDDIEPIVDFLQGSTNEPPARLTFRLAQWLAQQSMTAEVSQALAALIAQKIMLRTINEEEESDVLIELLKREDTTTIIPNILDSLRLSRAHNVLKRTTTAILETTSKDNRQKVLLASWLACLRASKTASSKHSLRGTKKAWNAVYGPLSQRFRPSDFAEHFSTLKTEIFTKVFWRHWVPNLVIQTTPNEVMDRTEEDSKPDVTSPSSSSVDWEALWSEYQNLRGSKENYLSPNNALVDLVAILSNHKLPYSTVLDELFAFWQKTESANGLMDLVRQLRQNHPPIDIPPALATSIIQSFMQSGDLGPAIQVFELVPTVSLIQCHELPIKLIEQGQMNGNKIWKMIDRCAEEDGVSLHEKQRRKEPLKQELVHLVHEAAYAWAKSPHLRARVAYRRVWECYRFLQDSHSPLSRLMSRALVRAGVVNFVRERRPVPKTRVQYILALVGKLEGEEVKREVDRMIFEYWIANRNLARYKPAGRQAREKFLGEQVLSDGSVRRVKWENRVLRKAVEMRKRLKAGVFEGRDMGDGAQDADMPIEADGSAEGEMEEVMLIGTDVVDEVEEMEPPIETHHAADGEAEPESSPVMEPEILRTGDALDSASEAQEIARMVLESRGVLEPERQTAEWAFVGDLLEDVDTGNAASYQPYGAAEIGAVVKLPPRGMPVQASEVQNAPLGSALSSAGVLEGAQASLKQTATPVYDEVSWWSPSETGTERDAIQPMSIIKGKYSARALLAQSEQGGNEDGSEVLTRAERSGGEAESLSAEIKALRVRIARLQKANYEFRQTATANPQTSTVNGLDEYTLKIEDKVTAKPAVSVSPKEIVQTAGSENEDRAELLSAALLLPDNDVKVESSEAAVGPSVSLERFAINYKPDEPSEAAVGRKNTTPRSLRRPETFQNPRQEIQRHVFRPLDEDMLVTWRLRPAKRHRVRPRGEDKLETKRLRPDWQAFEQKWAENRKRTGSPYKS